MFARSTTINGDSGAIDAGIAYVRDQVMPMLSEMPGYVGLSMMVDRESGRAIATTSWTTYDAMTASAANVSDSRAKAAEIMGGTPVVDEWEIAMMHREHDAHAGVVLPGHLGADGPGAASTRWSSASARRCCRASRR